MYEYMAPLCFFILSDSKSHNSIIPMVGIPAGFDKPEAMFEDDKSPRKQKCCYNYSYVVKYLPKLWNGTSSVLFYITSRRRMTTASSKRLNLSNKFWYCCWKVVMVTRASHVKRHSKRKKRKDNEVNMRFAEVFDCSVCWPVH